MLVVVGPLDSAYLLLVRVQVFGHFGVGADVINIDIFVPGARSQQFGGPVDGADAVAPVALQLTYQLQLHNVVDVQFPRV